VTQLVAPLVVDFFADAARPGSPAHRTARRAARCHLHRLRRASECLGTSRGLSRGSSRHSSSTTPPRAGSSSTIWPTPRVRVPRHVVRLVVWLVVDYSALRRSSSTTSPTLRVRVPRDVARLVTRLAAPLVVDYTDYAARLSASVHRAARRVARRRLLRLRRTSGCLGKSRGSSCGSSLTTPCTVTSSCGHSGSTLATWCIATTCLAATLALLRVRCALSQHRLPAASR
jgi:hypothetical protein